MLDFGGVHVAVVGDELVVCLRRNFIVPCHFDVYWPHIVLATDLIGVVVGSHRACCAVIRPLGISKSFSGPTDRSIPDRLRLLMRYPWTSDYWPVRKIVYRSAKLSCQAFYISGEASSGSLIYSEIGDIYGR